MNVRFYLSYDIKITLKSHFYSKNVIIVSLSMNCHMYASSSHLNFFPMSLMNSINELGCKIIFTVKVLKLNTQAILFLFSNKMFVIRAVTHKMLV